MILEVEGFSKLSDISDLFSHYYPFLKIEFFDLPHNWHESSSLKNMIPKTKLVSEVTSLDLVVQIEVHFWNKTGTVEQMFKNKAGLNIQIFRKYNNSWIQTVGTDELTLEEQNNIGRKDSEDDLHGTDRKFESEIY
jgi:hypothetical protein